YSSRPRLVLEMAFVRAAQVGAVTPVTDLLARLDGVLRGVTPVPAAAPAAPAAAGVLTTAEPSAQAPSVTTAVAEAGGPSPTPTAAAAAGRPSAAKEDATPDERATVPAAKERPAPEPVVIQTRAKEVRRHWEEFIEYVKDRKPWMAQSLSLNASTREEKGELVIRFAVASECKVLQDPDNLKYLTQFAQDFFQKELRVRISVRGAEPGAAADDGRDELQEERRVLANDPLVQVTSEVFNAQVVGIRTGPRSR
ncbi:MAG: hypothetical protein OEV73_12930, partial [Desulfobulbaceae bacterium]|nr:hypothetical protein [Desulfobulbaceae bacterium]